MIDGIRQNMTPLELNGRKGVKSETASAISLQGPGDASPAVQSEVVDLTAAKTGAGSAPLDRSRIEAIRSAIRDNAYPVDFDRLAERMIDSDIRIGDPRED